MFSRFRSFFNNLGPGLVTGASDDDPSGIATYSQAGAGFGYGTLWTVLFTIPLMIAVQEMSARIALVTGKGLVANMRSRYGRGWVGGVVALLAIANIFNIGADLGIMASAAQALVPLPFFALLLSMAILSLVLEIFTSYRTYARYLKWLTLSLFSYVLVAFVVRIDWLDAFRSTLVPVLQFHSEYLLILVAVLGTTISPYLYFWQANQELEEKSAKWSLRRMRADVSVGMILSNVVAWFIILTAAAVLFSHDHTQIASADQAAQVLAPIAGKFASILFALGIIGTGLLTIPILSGTLAYGASELFGWSEGLSKKWWQAKGFYAVLLVATLVGGLMNFIGIPPIKALIYAAVVNALIAPPILFILLRLGNDKKLMGQNRNGLWSNVFGGLTVLLMTAAPLGWLLISWKMR